MLTGLSKKINSILSSIIKTKMPWETKNYNDTPKEYEFKQKFDKLQKARDFWIDMIKDKKVKTPQKLMDYKSKVDLYSKQMRDVVEKNKTQKLDTNQAKYYKEMNSNKVEKEITDIRFDNLTKSLWAYWEHMTEFSVWSAANVEDVSVEFEDKVNVDTKKQSKSINIVRSSMDAFTWKSLSDVVYSLIKAGDWTYTIYFKNNSLLVGLGIKPYSESSNYLSPDQVNKCLDDVCNRLSKIEKQQKENKEKGEEERSKIVKKSWNFASIDDEDLNAKLDKAYSS